MPVLTFAIPVYNMCEWLAPTLESCLWQTHKDIEILVVNDGSRDNGLEIAEAYARIDSRIRIVSQENAGLGAARQKGQDEASGDYITWLDADDFLDKNAARWWLDAAVKNSADLVCANAVAFSSRTFNARRYFPHPPANELHFDSASRYWKSKVVWRWIFSLPFIRKHGITHARFKLGQDVCFTYATLLRAERFCQIQPAAYYFRQEHKGAYPSLDVQIEHALAHFIEVKRILLQDTPDGKPRIKPFVKYLNENYWRDVKKTAPRLVGADPMYAERLITLGFELFDGLDPDWFRHAALAPEIRERTDFLPLVDAMTARDKDGVETILATLQQTASPTPDKRNLYHTIRHRVKSLMNPLAYKAKLRLRHLERLAAGRKGIPRPEPLQGPRATR
ncbi:glycosyltransferase family 2 protein [Desulfovibrio sp. OttesenSCG-928-I05]|nr:glycosyltransferase family 2 protein [Desulfovibrio sp. OttesenSCG-928-I05]